MQRWTIVRVVANGDSLKDGSDVDSCSSSRSSISSQLGEGTGGWMNYLLLFVCKSTVNNHYLTEDGAACSKKSNIDSSLGR